MSAITEYIHYYQANYDKWGINRINTLKSENVTASFANTRNRLSNPSELFKLLAEAKKIEEDYNNLFFPKTPTDFSKMLEEVAQETLQEEFGAAAGKINKENFDVIGDKELRDYKQKIKNVRKIIEVNNLKKEATTQQILTAIKKLTDVLLNLENTKNSSNVQARIERAKVELNQIKKRIQTESGIKNLNMIKDIQTINNFIQQFNRSFSISMTGSVYNQRGDLFEFLLPLIKLKSTSLVGDELKKEMKSLVKANNLGASEISISFADFLNMPESELSTSVTAKNFKMSIANVRSKTDVIVQYEISPGRYKSIPVSAKSVSKPHVKLVDNTSLYNVLVFSKNYDFIKHYLNIITWSKQGGRASDTQIHQANRLVQGLIMQLAAQGFDLNNPSQLLIMHDLSQRKIKVYNIKALVYLIQQQLLQGNSKYKGLIKGFEGDNYTIHQYFEETVQKRLNYLLNEIKHKKLFAFIYGAQLDDYLKLLNGK